MMPRGEADVSPGTKQRLPCLCRPRSIEYSGSYPATPAEHQLGRYKKNAVETMAPSKTGAASTFRLSILPFWLVLFSASDWPCRGAQGVDDKTGVGNFTTVHKTSQHTGGFEQKCESPAHAMLVSVGVFIFGRVYSISGTVLLLFDASELAVPVHLAQARRSSSPASSDKRPRICRSNPDVQQQQTSFLASSQVHPAQGGIGNLACLELMPTLRSP